MIVFTIEDMIMIRNKTCREIVIDLSGPQGNAFALLGVARQLARDIGVDENLVIDEMRSSDYENLVMTFDKYFGAFVILER